MLAVVRLWADWTPTGRHSYAVGALVAQSEEQWTFNPRVHGSKPCGGTKKKPHP